MVDIPAGSTPLSIAQAKGHADIITHLVKGGAAIDHANKDGHTALCCASHYGHAAAVRLLLDAKADPSIGGKLGTPLKTARDKGHREVVEMLQAAGAME